MAQREREVLERRRKEAEEVKASRSFRSSDGDDANAEDNAVLDNLLRKLWNGDSVGRRSRRNRPGKGANAAHIDPSTDNNTGVTLGIDEPVIGDKTVNLARDMLAALKSDGFETFAPSSSTTTLTKRSPRRSRHRRTATLEPGTEEPRLPEHDQEAIECRQNDVASSSSARSDNEDDYPDDPDATMRV